MKIQTNISPLLQRINQFKEAGYSAEKPSPYDDRVTLGEVKSRTDRLLELLPGAISAASDKSPWKSEARKDPSVAQVTDELEQQARVAQGKDRVLKGGAAALVAGLAWAWAGAGVGAPSWLWQGGLGLAAVGGSVALAGSFFLIGHDLDSASIRQASSDLQGWGQLPPG